VDCVRNVGKRVIPTLGILRHDQTIFFDVSYTIHPSISHRQAGTEHYVLRNTTSFLSLLAGSFSNAILNVKKI
jgi:hypothetical protein